MPPVLRPARAAAAPLAAAALATCLTGCLRGRLPARELYRLPPASARPATGLTASQAGEVTRGPAADPPPPPLTVEPYATPGVYAGPEIVYRVGETRYGTYPNREWAVPLGAMLAALTADAARALDGGPERVQDGAAAGAPRGLVWRGVVREFEEVDRDRTAGGPRVSAAVRLEAQLVRAADDSVLWQGSARLERAVTPPDQMTAVVDGLADAARAVVARLVGEAAPAMRAAAGARGAVRP